MLFSPEAYEFLNGIRFHNEKEWFEPRKAVYQKEVYAPLSALGKALKEQLAGEEDLQLRVTRIYKDVSFHPTTRYRDTFYIYLRGESFWWNDSPALFVRLEPDGFSYGFQLVRPKPAVMELFRQRIDDCLPLIPDGFELDGETYKKPKPCPDDALLPYFRLKGIELRRTGEAPVEDIADSLRSLLPIYRRFVELVDEVNERDAQRKKAEKLKEPDSYVIFPDFVPPEPDF